VSKFFNIGRDEPNNSGTISPNNMNGYSNNQQGYPSNNMYNNNNNYNQQSETFVYNSYPQNQSNSDNYESMMQAENYMQNNQMNNYNNYNNVQQNYSNMDVLDESEVLDVQVQTNMQTNQMNQNVVVQEPQAPVLDPLNNANNPVPVNPVAPVSNNFVEEELPSDAKANLFSVIGMMFGMILTPGTTIVSNSKKYRSTGKALTVTTWITIVTMLLCIGVRVLVGSFNKTYSTITASYRINFDFTNVLNLDNYTQYLIVAFIISFVAIIIVSLIYYASSFLNSKGVPFGSYLMVSNLALQPLIVGVVVLYPVASLVSMYVALLVLIFTFLYSVVSFLIGIGEVLTFKNINRKILYNVLNLSVIVLIMIIIFIMLLNTSVIIMPDLRL